MQKLPETKKQTAPCINIELGQIYKNDSMTLKLPKITYVWRGPKFHVLARYWFPLVQVTEVLPCWWHCPEMSWRIACRRKGAGGSHCLLEHSSCSLDKTAQRIDSRQSSRINPMVHSRYCWAQAQKFSGTVSVPLKSASALKRVHFQF